MPYIFSLKLSVSLTSTSVQDGPSDLFSLLEEKSGAGVQRQVRI